MSGYQDGPTAEIPEADALEQTREQTEEPLDPESTVSDPAPDGIHADPADVVEQSIAVPVDEDEREAAD
ncbi:hypothetical protein [Microbacterium esteraromaticum]|uniref:hypothetical protein n=1 Tax=Microbacterium esteraromaticum TaxID=57043 RepID=UPI00195892D4|nr:hypothetical protein [Microbacterium esteraromaticum]MBM7464660.1 hypothetical protein [Microbacterium esteraromaticum]